MSRQCNMKRFYVLHAPLVGGPLTRIQVLDPNREFLKMLTPYFDRGFGAVSDLAEELRRRPPWSLSAPFFGDECFLRFKSGSVAT